MGKFIPKITDFGGCKPTFFKSHIGAIWHEGADLGLPPHAKFCKKNLLVGIGPLGADL